MKLATTFLSTLLAVTALARGDLRLISFYETPEPPPQTNPGPPSLGQQPFQVQQQANPTPAQTNTNQLNQLLTFETTPDICAAGEGYIGFDFSFLKYPGQTKQYRYQIQGQYAFSDQIAVGAFVPGITAQLNTTNTGLGDITIYGQYKLDKYINPEIIDLTAQVDVVLPTGNVTERRDTGKFGVRPSILAYKDFGQHGPGVLGVYASFGFTITTNSDARIAIGGTYQVDRLAAILEFYDQTGSHQGGPQVLVTPGLSYRGLSPWELTIGVPLGVDKGAPDWGVIAKLTYVFPN